jgi:hypothetical protein
MWFALVAHYESDAQIGFRAYRRYTDDPVAQEKAGRPVTAQGDCSWEGS